MTQTEALRMALEALERYSGIDQRACDAEDAIREALAQQLVSNPDEFKCPYCYDHGVPPPECNTEAEKTAFAFGWWKALEANRAQPEQEPVAINKLSCECGAEWRFENSTLEYTPAPQRKPLSDEEIKRMAAKWFLSMYWPLCNTFAREIEAAHGIFEEKK